jgi:hypothetical protein
MKVKVVPFLESPTVTAKQLEHMKAAGEVEATTASVGSADQVRREAISEEVMAFRTTSGRKPIPSRKLCVRCGMYFEHVAFKTTGSGNYCSEACYNERGEFHEETARPSGSGRGHKRRNLAGIEGEPWQR